MHFAQKLFSMQQSSHVGHKLVDSLLLYKNEKHFFFNEQKVGMLQKRADTGGVGISNMRKSVYLLTTTPTSC